MSEITTVAEAARTIVNFCAEYATLAQIGPALRVLADAGDIVAKMEQEKAELSRQIEGLQVKVDESVTKVLIAEDDAAKRITVQVERVETQRRAANDRIRADKADADRLVEEMKARVAAERTAAAIEIEAIAANVVEKRAELADVERRIAAASAKLDELTSLRRG